MPKQIQSNLVGQLCEVSGDPKREFRIVAVFLPDGAQQPSVSIAECRIGGGLVGLQTVPLDSVKLCCQDVALRLRPRK